MNVSALDEFAGIYKAMLFSIYLTIDIVGSVSWSNPT